VTQERLTRQELSWLLAQEARGAAKALREGVSQLKQPVVTEAPRIVPEVETTLDALDGAIDMLTELQQGARERRGRIDLAALLYQVAPNARISMQPGGGTEVFGEENELVRMLHVLLNQSQAGPGAGASSPDAGIRREGDFVKVSVDLGPDTSGTTDLERRWLSRMAVRYGGRLEFDGGRQSMYLPADGASNQRELEELRKELEQAQQLGEAYARELAAAFSAGSVADDRTSSPSSDVATARLDILQGVTRSLARLMRHWFEALRRESSMQSDRPSRAPAVVEPLLRRVSSGSELVTELERASECRIDEQRRRLDAAALVREAASATDARAARHGVRVDVELDTDLTLTAPREALLVLLRALLDHAIAATPKGGSVTLSLRKEGSVVALAVEDGGPSVPEGARSNLLRNRLDPRSLGRPAGPALLIADTFAAYLGWPLTIGEGASGRTTVRARLDGV
jgi:two-component system OmpR family sensor kinase